MNFIIGNSSLGAPLLGSQVSEIILNAITKWKTISQIGLSLS